MKQSLLLLFSLCLLQNVRAQWQGFDVGFNEVLTIWDMDAVDENTVWALGMGGIYSGDSWDIVPERSFTTTRDGGLTWLTGEFPFPNGINWVGLHISAVDADNAWVAGANFFGGGVVYHTSDGGLNWERQNVYNESDSYAGVIHFWDKNAGVTVGDPVGGVFEVFTTEDGGKNWIKVGSEGVPPPLPTGEYVSSNVHSVVGDHIWFGTNAGRIFHSKDRGKNWTVASTAIGDQPSYTWVEGIAFQDSLIGIAHSAEYTNNPFEQLIVYTEDGGSTWTKQPNQSGSFSLFHTQYIPGSSTLVATSRETNGAGLFRTSYSQDHGVTWTDVETETAIMDFDFIDDRIGWGGKFKNDNTPTQMYKYEGSPFSGIFEKPKLNIQINIFPNPTSEVAFVEVSAESSEDFKLRLTDIIGNILEEREVVKSQFFQQKIDLSKYASGVYTLIIQSENGILTEKIIKE